MIPVISDLFFSCFCIECSNSVQSILATTTTTILGTLYRSTCIRWYLQSGTGGFCWCKVLLPACPCLGMVELCAKNLQIMRNDFTDYALTFGQLCANYAHFLPIMRNDFKDYARTFWGFCQLCANYAHFLPIMRTFHAKS